MTTNKPGTVTQQPLFGCTRCYEDVSYPADHLHVYNGECWCESCWCEIADWRDWIKLEPFKPALQAENEALRAREAGLVEALERIMTWPDGGNRYGQANIKVFAAEALAAHYKQQDGDA